jgi:transcriptional regulator with XRE-family HTH domain
MMHFLGKNIRYLRKQSSVTQSELASVIGKGQTTIGNWENGISEPSLEELLILTNYFDISLDLLVKIDLSKTNYQTEKKRKEGPSARQSPVRYDHTPAEETTAGEHEEGLSYVLNEIKALREEVERISSLLPDAPAETSTGGDSQPSETP